MNSVLAVKHDNAMNVIANYKSDLAQKIQNGETEPSFQIGGKAFTQKEWDKIVDHVDKEIDVIKEEQKLRQEKMDEEKQVKELYEKMSAEGALRGQKLTDRITGKQSNVPYSYLAKDGVINYNGVTFVCDEEKHALCLGDMSDKKKLISVPMEKGGRLLVNRDNLGELSHAMGMFSPEDKKRILWAISTDKKCKSAEEEIEEDINGIGESAEKKLEE